VLSDIWVSGVFQIVSLIHPCEEDSARDERAVLGHLP